ncbi:nebulin-related-anchoring protein-like [Balaenoptera musculus]|uniref:Nebulin-related-anchoring protein-like n=1 Tax=Balaenoptera musculus TaxID=9771 RepID=A0A8B8VKK5_BALMU|nr:nebulin-related-anchoring protein-like [Balaenoptera musculus]
MTPLCISDLQFWYREAFLRDRGLQTGYRSIHDDPRMKHFLSVSKLQGDNEYGKDFAKSQSQFHSRPDQPGFLQAKRSQQLASSVCYRQPLPQPTCDPEQLGLNHAQKAHQLQSDVGCPHSLAEARPLGPLRKRWPESHVPCYLQGGPGLR